MPRHNGNTKRKKKRNKKQKKGFIAPRTGVASRPQTGGGFHKDKRTKRPADLERQEVNDAVFDWEDDLADPYEDWE